MSKDAIHLESEFEKYITRKLEEMKASGSWRVSNTDDGFDASTALYMPDFIEYLTATDPDKIKKMQDAYKSNWESNLTKALVNSLETDGTVMTLRNGFNMAGFQKIDCSGHYPDDPRLPKMKKLYDENILRVMRQVHYQTAGNKSLDLVFFINGIPVATAEVKTEFTQTVQDAVKEYQNERKPIEPGTNRKNFLLMYKRGAVVHFAISEDEIWMNTNLSGNKPKFIPFNRGNEGHAGNPPMKKGDTDYPTGYFWNEILRKDNWLRIFHNFIFEKIENKEDATGKMREVKTQYFPRYHQWDFVVKAIEDVKVNGVGMRYLAEHSPGSGKTETISWLSHELIRLKRADGDNLFSSVIVVTDRVGLDTNIKKTIKQLKKTTGLIAMIGGDGDKKSEGAKSKQLAEALEDKREIVVVTLQTFPYALDAIANNPKLTGSSFAVLIDEAHSAQGGSTSAKMKASLKLAAEERKKEDKFANKEDVTDEDLIDAYFQEMQSSKVMPENVSFFAFTATPKAETKTLFGRPGEKIDPRTGQPIPESFHVYTMRQAIEEGYILDVIKGYMPYSTAYKLKDDLIPDTMVDVRSAMKTIAKWQSMHPTNVMSKAEFIIEHFVKNVAPMLDGQAKAMIVTSSRPAVIRYKYAIDAYLKAHPEYDRDKIKPHLQFKVPGEPLVAFSDKVSGSKCIMTEDEYLENNPFAMIRRDYDYTEANMNNLGYQSVENAFDQTSNRILIVANKFQTGFNQPKLCAMYIDKNISNDIEIVQTYSRLNRIYPGKDTVYIIDFVNDPMKVLMAFMKYDQGAELEKAQDLNIIYGIKNELDTSYIYEPSDFEEYKVARYKSIAALDSEKDAYRQKLYRSVSVPADRWIEQYKAQQTAFLTWQNVFETEKARDNKEGMKYAEGKIKEVQNELDILLDFKRKLHRYCSAYSYISQIIDFGDPDLEVFHGFAKLLWHKISDTSLDEIDVKMLVLSDYRITPIDIGIPDTSIGGGTLKPMNVGGRGSGAKKESLRAIIRKINEIWGNDVSPVTGARTINAIADYVSADDVTRIQIANSTNSKEAVIADGRLESIIKLAALSLKNNDFEELAEKIISDPQTWKPIAEIIFDLVDNKKRIDLGDLADFLKQSPSD